MTPEHRHNPPHPGEILKGSTDQIIICRSRIGGNPVSSATWMPAFAGMTSRSYNEGSASKQVQSIAVDTSSDTGSRCAPFLR